MLLDPSNYKYPTWARAKLFVVNILLHDMHSSSGWHVGREWIPWLNCWNGASPRQIYAFCAVEKSSKIWVSHLKQIASQTISTDWQDILDTLGTNSSWKTHLQMNIAKFGFASTVYHIWRERNNRIYKQANKETKILLKEIFDSISFAAVYWRGYKCNRFNWGLTLKLGISRNIFSKP